MIIRICRKEASKRLNINNTVQAERSAVTDSQHIGCVSERRDLAYVPIADNHKLLMGVQPLIWQLIPFLYISLHSGGG